MPAPRRPKAVRPSSPEDRRVTLADVGRHCGFHGTTVGLALRNCPSIPEATRVRIKAAAEELGYRPDPILSSLIAHRRSRKSSRYQATVALVSDRATPTEWRGAHPVGEEFYGGLKQRAAELGFLLEEYTLGHDRQHTARLERIFRARGIRGLVILPLDNLEQPVEFAWDSYCAVASGYSLCAPELPRITHHHRLGAETAFHQAVARGYRRIGLALAERIDARVNYGWSAGFLGAAVRHRQEVETCLYRPEQIHDLRGPAFLHWIRTERPDALVTTEIDLADYLREHGWRVPEDIGLAFLDRRQDDDRYSGIFQCFQQIGVSTIDLLSGLFLNNNHGLPAVPYSILLAGQWRDGATLRPGPAPADPTPPAPSPGERP